MEIIMEDLPKIEKKESIVYFEICFEHYNLEEDLENGKTYLKGNYTVEDYKNGSREIIHELLDLEFQALKSIEKGLQKILDTDHVFPTKVFNEGHGSFGSLICGFSVNTISELKKVHDYILSSTYTISDDIISADDISNFETPYYTIQGFRFYPNGLGSESIDFSDWDYYIEDYVEAYGWEDSE